MPVVIIQNGCQKRPQSVPRIPSALRTGEHAVVHRPLRRHIRPQPRHGSSARLPEIPFPQRVARDHFRLKRICDGFGGLSGAGLIGRIQPPVRLGQLRPQVSRDHRRLPPAPFRQRPVRARADHSVCVMDGLGVLNGNDGLHEILPVFYQVNSSEKGKPPAICRKLAVHFPEKQV